MVLLDLFLAASVALLMRPVFGSRSSSSLCLPMASAMEMVGILVLMVLVGWGLLRRRWEELGLCCWVAGEPDRGCLAIGEVGLDGIGMMATG